MTILPMFPLGSVLFPYMPAALRIFEERYIVMLSKVLGDDPAEFGIVLIERGSEVGGGEQRFPIGTVAQITQVEASEGFIGLVAQGSRRVEILQWLEDDPHPQAEVGELPDLTWDSSLQPLRDHAEKLVRRTIARASEFVEQQWPANIVLDEDPVAAAWQLAGIAPVGPLDQQALLRCASMEALLRGIIEATEGAAEVLLLPSDDDFPSPDDVGSGSTE